MIRPRLTDAAFDRPSARAAAMLLAMAGLFAATGCTHTKPPPPEPPRYTDVGLRTDIPPYMGGTLYERVNVINTDTFPTGGYSLVVNLHGTGDARGNETRIPTVVRDYIRKQIDIHGFDSQHYPEFANLSAEQIMHDPKVAVVMVQGMIPAGARRGDRFDVTVRALPGSYVTSLAHGTVYDTTLSEHGLQYPSSIRARPLVHVGTGPVFTNPMYALDRPTLATPANIRNSLRVGTVLGGGTVIQDRPILLQLRTPELRLSRLIEGTIVTRFQTRAVAQAEDEGLVQMFVPPQYAGDWKHFVGVVTHLYLNASPEFMAAKARELHDAARQKDAKLMDISLCWEALGPDAVTFYADLMNDPSPDVSYAAARAAAFVGDPTARRVLVEIARADDNPFQLPAVQTLGALPPSPETRSMLRALLAVDNARVRVAAYDILARAADANPDDISAVASRIVGGDRFKLDVVDSGALPLVYATRTGVPRLAVFGRTTRVARPITFMALDTRLTISSNTDSSLLTIFYRDPGQTAPTIVYSGDSLEEVIARLGGDGAPGDARLNFSYADIVAIVQKMIDEKLIVGARPNRAEVAASFILQAPVLDAALADVPALADDKGRPQGNGKDAPADGAAPTVTPGDLNQRPAASSSAEGLSPEHASSLDPTSAALGRVAQ